MKIKTVRVADYIMQKLSESGVSQVFQVTGRGTLFLSDPSPSIKN